MTEPKPCPWCGGEAEVDQVYGNVGDYYAVCSCGLIGPECESEGEAIAAWNRIVVMPEEGDLDGWRRFVNKMIRDSDLNWGWSK